MKHENEIKREERLVGWNVTSLTQHFRKLPNYCPLNGLLNLNDLILFLTNAHTYNGITSDTSAWFIVYRRNCSTLVISFRNVMQLIEMWAIFLLWLP